MYSIQDIPLGSPTKNLAPDIEMKAYNNATTFDFETLLDREKPALLIGNGINRFNESATFSWDSLLAELARRRSLAVSEFQSEEMSNTEFFNILELAEPQDSESKLLDEFCELMRELRSRPHHMRIVSWAKQHKRPIITVNFDSSLSDAVNTKFHREKIRFTDFYPWASYFSDQEISLPRSSFAIWHAHGMMRYKRSIRLGLTHYMLSVERASSWIRGSRGLVANLESGKWQGSNTWLDAFFFSPLLILGFGFGKDETFLRWLFLERARLHKRNPALKKMTWFVDVLDGNQKKRRPFFEGLGFSVVYLNQYSDLYENPAWLK